MKTITYEETKPITYRADGLAFELDYLRPGWLRCSQCLDLIPAGGAAIKRHECRYVPALGRSAQREPGS